MLTSCFRGYQKDELGRIRIEVIHGLLTVLIRHRTTEEADIVACVVEQMLKHLQELDTVRENENLVPISMPEL